METAGRPARRGRPSSDLARTAALFRRFMGPPRVYVAGVLFLLVEAVTAVVEPYPIAYLVDWLQNARQDLRDLGAPAILSSARYDTVLLLTLAIVLIAAVNSAADSLTEVCMARGGRSLGYSIRVAMYSHLQRLSLAYHDKRRTGDVLTRVTGDVLVVEDFVVKSVSNILGSLLVLVGSFAFLAYKSWSVALISLVVVPVLAGVSNHYSRRIKVASKTQRDREGDLASTAQEMLTSIRLVQSYGRGTVDLEQFSDQTGKSMRASLVAANIQAQFSFVIALMEALAISAVVWLGVWLIDQQALTIGTLVLFVLLLQNMFKPARKIVSEWYKVGKVFASAERIQDLLDREVVVQDLPDAVPAPPLEGRLTFRGVSFAYPVEHPDGTPQERRPRVLDDVSFDVAPGEVVALAGHSGAGKSTIAQLVPRLYDPDEGEVLVDGRPVRGLTLASLRDQVSLVLQETVLLSGSVAENIRYGVEDASQEDIEAAARMANAHEFILDLPEGYETMLGERGSTLSGGQRQRLAIARAFIRRAPILILDEPTTGLDMESARSVVSALRSLMQGTTTIVVSHDPDLIRCADRVLVIGDGRIVEEGRPQDVARIGGTEAGGPDEARRLPAPGPRHAKPVGRARRGPGRDAERSDPRSELVAGLEQRLAGLGAALDPALAAERLQRLPGTPAPIEHVAVGKLWLRDEGACDLRYEARFGGDAGDADPLVVLGRVVRDPDAATTYVAEISHMPSTVGDPEGWLGSPDGRGEPTLALSRFPFDPGLPTLALTTDPSFLGGLEPFAGQDQPPVVRVVHHPREGACVLRYASPSPAPGGSPTVLFGKVYPDGTGAVVDGFLRALPGALRQHGDRYLTSFPQPVLYDPGLRLLVTEALPGTPRVRELLKALLLGAPAGAGAGARAELRRAVEESARALAALHRSDLTTAPVHGTGWEVGRLERELGVVAAVWPEQAARVAAAVQAPSSAVESPPDLVLSHGDFTPSQVLLDGPASAVVDLDTLCWADPALDLGRYLAHLRLLAVKVGGQAALNVVEGLGEVFRRAYAEVSPRTSSAATARDRIAFYMTTTLAQSALHSCRQLKPDRYETAMSLLETERRRINR